MKGHPILGVTTGFFFGLFLGITLFMFGVIPLSSDLLWILPLLGILLGLIMAAWAPFGKRHRTTPKPSSGDSSPVPPPPPADPEVDVADPAADENETGEMELSDSDDGEDESGDAAEDSDGTNAG
jgi:predicted lipid-binding transport protein (Tim44 family)